MRLLRLILVLILAAAPLYAQNQITAIDLSTHWLIYAGNNPAFAAPSLDDTQWPAITPGYLIPIPPGTTDLWYRAHLTLPPHAHDLTLALLADNLSDPGSWAGCPEFFVNGVLLGQARGFPQCFAINQDFLWFAIPNQSLPSGELVVAIHFVFRQNSTAIAHGGLHAHAHLLLAPSLLLENQHSLYLFRNYSSNVTRALLVCLLLIIVIAFALNLREAAEYRVLIVFLVADLLNNLLLCSRALPGLQTRALYNVVDAAGDFAAVFSLISFSEFVRLVLRVRRSFPLVAYYVVLAGYTVFVVWFFSNPATSDTTIASIALGSVLLAFPITALLPIPVLWAWRRRGNQDALLLSIPLLVRSVVAFDDCWRQFTFTILHRSSALLPPMQYVNWFEVSDITFLITLLIFIVVRTVRIVRARAALVAEVHAARSVQQLLLNRSTQPTPGFHVETVYLPASEVGGDFFLVSPDPVNNSLVVIVGDVSGKGLTAAMRVAMILGILRRETSRNPAQVLHSLNQALLAQTEMGFTTACCIHLQPSGRYTFANAGHIAPYLGGLEIEAPPALPLGLDSGQAYDVLEGHILPAQTLVLLSDGVPEARNPQGALYGFDRLSTLTLRSAAHIAATAQAFGQEDDITVLTIALA